MKLKTLALCVAASSLYASLPTHAVYNLYRKDGLSFDVHGEINLNVKNTSDTLSLQNGASGYVIDNDKWVQFSDAYTQRSDRRTRLGQDPGASWLEFRGSQEMNNDWRVTGTVGLGYADSQTGAYLNTANIVFDKKDQGAIGIGRQYLHTGYVTRTGTYTPLDNYGDSSIRLDYTAIPNLHLSGYYSTPTSSDVRYANNSEVEGFGASASYLYKMADNQSLRFAAGYSDSRINPEGVRDNVPDSQGRVGNQVPVDSKGVAASLEYRNGKFLAAVDYGVKEEELNGTVVAGADSDYLGVKLGYQFTPKFSMTVGYGTQDIERKYQSGVMPMLDQCDFRYCTDMFDLYSSFLFGKSEHERAYVRGDYYLRENVRLYGRMDKEEIQNKHEGRDVSRFENTTYRAGVSFSF